MTTSSPDRSEATDAQTIKLRRLAALFEPLASKADPQPVHWVGGGDDCAQDYCLSCCEAQVLAERAADEKSEAFVDGGWEAERDSDHPAYCGGCGCLLGFTLTSYGIGDELYHFEHGGVDRAINTPDEAYEVVALLDACAWSTNAHAQAAIAVGQALAAFSAMEG